MSSIQEAMRKARAEREGQRPRLGLTARYTLPEPSRQENRGKKVWKVGAVFGLCLVTGIAVYLKGDQVVSGAGDLARRLGLAAWLMSEKGDASEDSKGVPFGPQVSSEKRALAPDSGERAASGTPARRHGSRWEESATRHVGRKAHGQPSDEGGPYRQGQAVPSEKVSGLGQVRGQQAGTPRTKLGTQDTQIAQMERVPTLQDAKRMRMAGDVQGAEEVLKAIVEKNPTDVDAKVALANLYLQDLQDLQRAFPLYQHALALEPRRVSVQVNLGVYYIRAGNLQKAAEHLQAALAISPLSAEAHYNLACVHALRGDTQNAQLALRRASEIDPRASQWAKEDPDLASLRQAEERGLER